MAINISRKSKVRSENNISGTIQVPPNNTEIQIGDNLFVTCYRKKPFTKKQIENIEKYFGLKVKNL